MLRRAEELRDELALWGALEKRARALAEMAELGGRRRRRGSPYPRPGAGPRRPPGGLEPDGGSPAPVRAIRRTAGDRIGPCRRGRHGEPGLGGDARCACTCAGRTTTATDRDPRSDRGRGGGAQERHVQHQRAVRVWTPAQRARRPSPGPDQPLRLAEAAPHQLCAGRGDARGGGGRRGRDRRQGPARRHVSRRAERAGST